MDKSYWHISLPDTKTTKNNYIGISVAMDGSYNWYIEGLVRGYEWENTSTPYHENFVDYHVAKRSAINYFKQFIQDECERLGVDNG